MRTRLAPLARLARLDVASLVPATPQRSLVRGRAVRVAREAAAGSDSLPGVGQQVELFLAEAREEVLAHDCEVRPARFGETFAAEIGEARERSARVLFAGAPRQEPLALESVDQPREPAARELRLSGEVAHAHSFRACALEMVQDLVRGQRQ